MKHTVFERAGAEPNYLGLVAPEASRFDKLKRAAINVSRLAVLDKKAIAEREATLHNLAQFSEAFIVQVGAFNGEYDDPLEHVIAEHDIEALLVEPQRDAFAELQEKYKNRRRIKCVRTAIAESAGELTLYRATMENGDKFGLAYARTNRESLQKGMKGHPLRVMRGYRVEQEVVPAVTLQQLLDGCDVKPESITMFCTDTEGMDTEITNQLFGTQALPEFVQYEHLHTSGNQVTDLNMRLNALGYDMMFTYTDVIARR